MNWQNMFYCFVFNYNHIFHEHINTITSINVNCFIQHWKFKFTNDTKSHFPKFIFQAFLVCGFQQTRSKSPMDTNSSANDTSSQRIKIHIYPRPTSKTYLPQRL